MFRQVSCKNVGIFTPLLCDFYLVGTTFLLYFF